VPVSPPKKCWNSEPPQVAMTLTTLAPAPAPAPGIVPYTPKEEASPAARTAATALPATWGTLRSIRFRFPPPDVSSEVDCRTTSGLSRIPGPCLPFPHQIDSLYEKGTYDRNHSFRF